jgi:hypothetical protein
VWDATAEFSNARNPNGVWSYGWMPVNGTTFTVYPQLSGGTAPAWFDPAIAVLGAPATWKNMTNAPQYRITAGQMAVHPGNNGERSLVRFTAPATAVCEAVAEFLAGDTGDTSAIVMRNGSTLFTAPSTNAFPVFSSLLAVQAGDTLDFGVGLVEGGNFYSGNTGIGVVVRCE